jgi:hypothetical protein
MAEINLKQLSPAISEIEVFFNENSEGLADATIPLNVNLTDGAGDVVPTSVSLTGNDLDIVIPPVVIPSGVLFDFPFLTQYTSYRTGDSGWRVQNGWNAITRPTNPKAIAELDTTLGANMYFRLKNNLVVNGVSSKIRYVDVLGGQTWSATNNVDAVILDKLTGLMTTRVDLGGGSVNWNTCIDDALTYSITVNGVTYDDWYLFSLEEVYKIFGFIWVHDQVDPISSVRISNFINSVYHNSNTTPDSTGFSNSVAIDNLGVTARQTNKVSNTRKIFVRNAQNLITAP